MMLNVSIVLYRPHIPQVEHLLAILHASSVVRTVYLVDNTPEPSLLSFQAFLQAFPLARYIHAQTNLGYGAGHNVAIRHTLAEGIKYHLVVNADIDFPAPVLEDMLGFMEQNPQVGQLMPKVISPDGSLQYLCKLLPTPSDLFCRRFLPDAWTKRCREKYELRATGYNRIMNVPYLSGCFMLLRTAALQKVGLFDERYFMYPEDIDLTRRIHREFQTLYYPYATVVHQHGRASYKDIKMLWVHIWNICLYFNKWGWFFDKERKEFNRITLASYG